MENFTGDLGEVLKANSIEDAVAEFRNWLNDDDNKDTLITYKRMPSTIEIKADVMFVKNGAEKIDKKGENSRKIEEKNIAKATEIVQKQDPERKTTTVVDLKRGKVYGYSRELNGKKPILKWTKSLDEAIKDG